MLNCRQFCSICLKNSSGISNLALAFSQLCGCTRNPLLSLYCLNSLTVKLETLLRPSIREINHPASHLPILKNGCCRSKNFHENIISSFLFFSIFCKSFLDKRVHVLFLLSTFLVTATDLLTILLFVLCLIISCLFVFLYNISCIF